MTVLICFDVDGTLASSGGPVPLSRLAELDDAGVQVVVVSPSHDWPQGRWPWIASGAQRADNLREARASFGGDLCLYVSDNLDRDQARAAGFIYIEASEFR